MARGELLSILGLYQFDNTIFDKFVIPDSIDKKVLINNLLTELAEFEIVYADAEFMKNAIGFWSLKEIDRWNKISDVINSKYDPFISVDRTETYENTIDELRTQNINGTSNSKIKENQKTNAWNDGLVDKEEKETESNNSDSTTGTTKGDRGEKGFKRVQGDSALYTKQDMIKQEIELRKNYNLDDIIIDEFKQRFCLLIY